MDNGADTGNGEYETARRWPLWHAAPPMYKALRECYTVLRHLKHHDVTREIDLAAEALAVAEGRSVTDMLSDFDPGYLTLMKGPE